jgi:Ca2+-binding EF-hand superfamily protein
MNTVKRLARTLLAISLCTGLTLASVAFAADDSVTAQMKAMDTNGDGMVSANEHADYARAQFQAMDADHNGQVTVAEMDAWRKAQIKGKAPANLQPSSVTLIKSLDSNNDGTVSAEEYATAAEKDFNAMDTNHDGKLTADEMRIAHDTQVASNMPVPGSN